MSAILQVLPSLNAGGVERGTLEIGRALVATGHRSVVVSGGGAMVPQLQNEGSHHLTLPVGRKSLASLRLIPQLKRLLREVDLVHVRSRLPAWLIYLAWRGLPESERPRLVTTVHGRYSVNAYSAIMTRGERVIAISKNVFAYISENYPQTELDKVTVIQRGVDPAEFPHDYQPSPEWLQTWHNQQPQTVGKRLLALPARISRWKGHESFLRLLKAVVNERQSAEQPVDIHALIIGAAETKQQPFLAELNAFVNQHKLTEHVSFLGQRDDMRDLMSISAATYNLSTRPEPFGRTMIEALSLGRPVIAWDYGGAAESVAAYYPEGLVATHDEAALLQKTLAVLAAPSTPIAPLGSPFLLADMQAATLAVYSELLARGH